MRYFDIAQFEVPADLCKRLGYKKIYSGADIGVHARPDIRQERQIIMSKDLGVLVGALRDGNVIGIMLEDNELVKRAVEKAADLKKTVFVPVNQIVGAAAGERSVRINRIRKVMFYAHRLNARVRVISLAESRYQLLSAAQMAEVARLLLKNHDSTLVFGGDLE